MIDLIIIQQRWKSSVINCRTFQGADINSDHSLVLCNIKLKLKNLLNKPKQNRRLDTRQLNDQITRKSYQIQLENQLNNIQANSNIDEHALQIEQAIKEALRVCTTTQQVVKKGKVTIRNGWLRKPSKKQGFRNNVKCINHKKQGFRIDF
jgi:hypothetical protein